MGSPVRFEASASLRYLQSRTSMSLEQKKKKRTQRINDKTAR